mgnify:CR=1 FL=1
MKRGIIILVPIAILYSFLFCSSYRIPENVRYDFTTQGPITDDVFQVIISAKPGINTLTQYEQRESAFITAKNIVFDECINQMLRYYCFEKKTDESSIPADKMVILKTIFKDFASDAVIEQEYYMPDNSAVFVVRIYSAGIKSKILNY